MAERAGNRATRAPTLLPTFQIDFGLQAYDTNVGVSDYPVTHGPVLVTHEPEVTLTHDVERALLEDARKNHYVRLVSSWERFVASVSKNSRSHRELVEMHPPVPSKNVPTNSFPL